MGQMGMNIEAQLVKTEKKMENSSICTAVVQKHTSETPGENICLISLQG